MESWNTLLDAATKRNHCSVLTIANHTADGEIPNLKYHKTCRSRFTLKRDLNNLQQNDDVPASQKVRRTSRDEVSHEIVLPKKCIFCDKMDKYLPGTKTREKLVSCETLTADKKIRESAEEKHDERIMKIATDELIAKEVCYHKRCYSAYTILLYNDERECQPKTEHISDIAFNAIKEKLLDLHKNQTITEFSNFTQAVEQYLVSKEFEKVEINSAKWNLRRKIESKSRDFKFLNIHRILLIYPESITVENVIETYYEMKTELDTLKQISKEEKTASYCELKSRI